MLNVRKVLENNLPEKLRKNYILSPLSWALSKIVKEDEINQFMADHAHSKGYDFVDGVLDYFEFSYQVSARSKESIPPSGRCVIVANHPLGGLDGLALLHMILNIRPDVKIVANELLSTIDALDEYLLPVNNMGGENSKEKMAAINRSLEKEQAVIIFPSGAVSRTKWFKVSDGKWRKGFYQFAKATESKIVPVFIGGKNSFWFYAWSKINSSLSMLLLPRQMWRQKNRVITMKVGTPLEFSMLKQLPVGDLQKVKMIRKHVYKLAKNRKGLFEVADPVAHPERRRDLREEINNECEILGRDTKDQQILLFEAKNNSPLLREIGRLRELTFRQVGEGSSQRRDLDKYDSYYDHLVIWNDQDLEIMGAYRVFPTQNLMEKGGLEKLYTSTLFDYNGDLNWLEEGLELGRSFVQPRYWGSRSLDYLWQGIGAFCARNSQIRYLFGTVSISASYPKDAMDYMIAYFRYYFSSEDFDVKSKNSYVLTEERQQHFEKLFEGVDQKSAYKEMKMYLRGMDLVVPALFKHYSELCDDNGAVFTDFGVDSDFGDCVDGFVIIDLTKVKANKYARYFEPFIQQNSTESADSSEQ